MSIMKQLREVGKLLELDCGDSSCYFTNEGGGMRTNGGCTCDLPEAIQNLKWQIRRWEDREVHESMECWLDNRRNEARIEELEKELDKLKGGT